MGWLAGYDYRRQIPITGQGGSGTDYQVQLEVHLGLGADAAGVVYLINHCQDFPNDIRFTDNDGTTELDHWLEEFDIENNKATFWIEIADDLGSNQSFHIYYGKAADASDSNGDNTFLFFDDFELDALDAAKWDVEQGSVDLQSDLVPSGSTEPHIKPVAQYYSGTYNRTYFVYLTRSKKVQIRYYDHDSDVVSSPTTLHTYGSLDIHDNPAILILSDGKILVFYGHHNSVLYVKKSTNAEDISSWGSAITVEGGGTTYRQPILLSNGDVWVFYRYVVGANHMTWCYRVSSDDGGSWGARTTLIDFGDGHFIYGHVISGGTTIHVAWWRRTMPADVKENVYYIYSPDNGTTWKRRDGTNKTPPIDAAEADLVYDTPVGKASAVTDIKLDGSNNPYIAFVDDLASDPGDGRFAKYAAGWSTYFVCDIDQVSGLTGALVIDDNDVYAIYAAVPDAGKAEIQKWTSPDSGENWAFSSSITDDSKYDNLRPQVVKGYQSSFKLLWWGSRYYTSYTDYDAFLLSDPSGLQRYLELDSTTGLRALMEGKTIFSAPAALVSRAMASLDIVQNTAFLATRKQNDGNERAGQFYGNNLADRVNFITYRGGVTEATNEIVVSDVIAWHEYKVLWDGLDDAKAYIDDVLKATHTTRVTAQDQVIFLFEGTVSDNGVSLLDWLFVRKYNDPEPVVGTAGGEETTLESPKAPAYGLDPMIF